VSEFLWRKARPILDRITRAGVVRAVGVTAEVDTINRCT
jgi:hypothetical protein